MPESDNFEWLIKARSLNQEALLRLYRFAKDKSEELRCDAIGRSVFALLTGAGFSLWRGAFLSDATRRWSMITADGTKLLERLVRDNAVAYPQDRETREWMAGYYLNNAQWRLLLAWRELEREGYQGQVPDVLLRLKHFEDRGTEEEPPMELWDASHAALLELFDLLEKRVGRN